ncbi:zinc knuckle [Ancylostoma caninum]|uniref:Zinc knuckle n=1 Tax=Ancylostoma caninum TaxID=29170 RepID=A0A368GP96_ANCCA|nr:zinc knuckle [Ancylostoma caninum]
MEESFDTNAHATAVPLEAIANCEAVPTFVQVSWEDLNRLMAQGSAPSTSTVSVPATQPRHTFTKTGLARQYEHNCEVFDLLSPVAAFAPEEQDVKKTLDRALELIRQRNELLVVADSDPAVFAFVDQRKKAEELETSNPVLAAYFKEKKKEEPKKVSIRSQTWKLRRPSPYPSAFQRPFRYERPAWAPEPLFHPPMFQYGFQPRPDAQPHGVFPNVTQRRQMCYSCGKFGHFFRDCKFNKSQSQYNRKSALFHSDFVTTEVANLTSSGAVKRVSSNEGIRINPLSVAKGKKLRLILDLSDLNKCLNSFRIKYEDMSTVVWVPREHNVDADLASRLLDLDDWSVSWEIFKELDSLWGGSVKIPRQWTLSAGNRNGCGPPDYAGPRWKSLDSTADLAHLNRRQDLQSALQRAAQAAVAPSTLLRYSSIKGRFLSFLAQFQFQPEHLSKYRNLFLAHLVCAKQFKCIPVAAAALSFFYGSLEKGDQEVQQLISNLANKEAAPVIHRNKASAKDVSLIIQWALSEGSHKAIVIATFIMLAFLAFLRISEAVSIRWEHISLQKDDTWWLHIPKSKTDQAGVGSTVAFRMEEEHTRLWNTFTSLPSSSAASSAFVFTTQSGKPFSTSFASKSITWALEKAGLAHLHLTSHSFRGGAATEAIRKGVHQEDVKRVGRWRTTSAFLSYVDPTPLQK